MTNRKKEFLSKLENDIRNSFKEKRKMNDKNIFYKIGYLTGYFFKEICLILFISLIIFTIVYIIYRKNEDRKQLNFLELTV